MSMKLIYHKISEIQKNLMGEKIEDYSLNTLIPLIFKECQKQNLMFFFNFIENACVLNIRGTSEDMELNVRYHHNYTEITPEISERIESRLLQNTFLLVSKGILLEDVVENEPEIHEHKKRIHESDLVPPRAIRAAMEDIEKRGETPTRKLIEKELHLDKMSTDNRRLCIAFLRSMED